MKKELLALALAGTLLLPHATPALSSEPARPASSESASWKRSPLPPVPYLDTMPWLASGSIWKEPQIDSTWRPDIWRPDIKTIGPFELPPAAPGSFSGTLTNPNAEAPTSG
jgi:hypothetical protein